MAKLKEMGLTWEEAQHVEEVSKCVVQQFEFIQYILLQLK